MRWMWGVVLIVVVIGCAGPEPVVERRQPAAGGFVTDRAVPFFDARPFDQDVSAAMQAEAPMVTVALLAPTRIDTIPPRLGTWLAAVKERGGQVDVQPDPEASFPPNAQAKGLIEDGLSVLWRVVQALREWQLYGPASQYHATLYCRGGGELARVVFTRKRP